MRKRGISVRLVFQLVVAAILTFILGCESNRESLPRLGGRSLDDLAGVFQVDVALSPAGANHRIIHICDWHLVERERFERDARNVSPLHDAEVGELFEEHLQNVEAVQADQLVGLRRLIADHELKQVFQEGLTIENADKFPGLVEAVRRLEGQVVEFDDLVDRVEAERLAAATGGNADQYAELAADAKAKAAALRQELRIRKLAMGAAGQLYMAGELETILPLEELMAYEAANPQQPDGSFRLDDSAQEARHDAIVRQALSHGNEAVIVLGAAHDLSGAIKRAAADCEYARITVVKVKRLMQEESGPD